MNAYYDRQGNPIDMFEWARRVEAGDNHVDDTMIEDVRISTVWLGLNHNWLEHGPPLIFETMIFGLGDDEVDEYCWRWSTEIQALAGHDQACAMVRDALVRRR